MFPNGSTPSLGAKVTYIQPQVDPMTRTLKVRLDANNPGLRMKPDMFVNVEFGVAGAKELVVPADAVLDTGDRQTVFVDLGQRVSRAAPGRRGRTLRRPRRDHARAVGRRARRVVRHVPDRLREPAEGRGERHGRSAAPARHRRDRAATGEADGSVDAHAGAEAPTPGGTAMINALIEFSAKNRFLVFLLVAVATVAGVWSMKTVPLDAIPDLSDTQVIVYSRWDRSPDIVEDQVTYPIVTAMLGAPKVKAVRGFSDFGYSYVYIVFEEGTDIYWARSRTLEYLSGVLPRLPQGVRTELGPDATGVGWVFQYALVDTTGRHSLAELRSYQDWYLRYYLKSVPGVAEVAPLGGFVRQYQVQVDPESPARRSTFRSARCVEAVRAGNNDVGGRLVEMTGAEYMVRGRGYAKIDRRHRRDRARAQRRAACPCACATSATVTLGPDLRRGVADLNGTGDIVAGIVVMRQGENALQGHRARQGQAQGARAGAAAGRQGGHDVRPLGPDPALHRQPEAHADRRADHRRRRSS